RLRVDLDDRLAVCGQPDGRAHDAGLGEEGVRVALLGGGGLGQPGRNVRGSGRDEADGENGEEHYERDETAYLDARAHSVLRLTGRWLAPRREALAVARRSVARTSPPSSLGVAGRVT